MVIMDFAIVPEPWMDDALCTQVDPEIFFPGKEEGHENAKRVCDACSVAEQCLQYALRNDEKHGIWGGVSAALARRAAKNGQNAA